MHFNKHILVLIVSALGAAPLVSAAADVAQAINKMNEMSASITAAKASLDNYEGGILEAREVAKSIKAAEYSARAARKHLEEGDSLTPEEASLYFENYEQMAPVLLDAIGSAKDKVRPLSLGQALLSNGVSF
jgi:phosphoribosylformylglycinamidine (FGAM) synthase-like enzyme